jgi:uncharacterized membrane protein YvlD (DUF360 family)
MTFDLFSPVIASLLLAYSVGVVSASMLIKRQIDSWRLMILGILILSLVVTVINIGTRVKIENQKAIRHVLEGLMK